MRYHEDLVRMYQLTMRFRHQKPASLGGDIGCGNGKYINVRKDVFILGCDRSFELIKIVQERGHEVRKSLTIEVSREESHSTYL